MNIIHSVWDTTKLTAFRVADAAVTAGHRVKEYVPKHINGHFCALLAFAMATTGVMAQAADSLCTATITDGDTVKVVLTLSDDPATVMAQAGVEVEPEDVVSHEFESAEMHIEITRAFDLPILVEGRTVFARVAGGTVAEALKVAGITLGEKDTLNVAADAPVSEDMTVVVARVAYREYQKSVKIAYSIKYEYDKSVRAGKTVVKTAGKKGEKTVTYRDKIVDGEVVDTEVVEEIVTKTPVTELRLVGTNNAIPLSLSKDPIELNENGQPLKYKKVLSGMCTAYSSEEGTVGTRTSTGMKAQVGVVAVNPKVIPYGTKLYIVSANGKYVYGYAVAGDTGGGVMRNDLLCDLFMDTIKECNTFGRRQMNVYILE